ncbi:DUF5959 family protein [Streptomyces coelicoflavus]|uniref:DUF5959 family protein n=1 Tax=Streptomyces coelicoflavus TaxID=285562 RepID=UPI003B97E7B5
MGPDPVDILFVSGRIHLALYVARLESWANVLDRLDAGEDVAWMEMSRGPSICVQLTGECDGPEVVVEDESGSMVTVRVPATTRPCLSRRFSTRAASSRRYSSSPMPRAEAGAVRATV